MGITYWNSFGASTIGPAHIRAFKPNQDAWAAFHHTWGDGIVVSDGVGSKPLSEFGSRAACVAVSCAAQTFATREIELSGLPAEIHKYWLLCVAPLPPRDCAATCLFAIRPNNGDLLLGMLGDGLVAVVKNDGSVKTLTEDKNGGFSNQTAALSTSFQKEQWRVVSIPEEECRAVILCSDGVADDLTDALGFVHGFVNARCELSAISAARHTREMLENWKTPKHSDDKTLACLYREEVADE